MRPIGASPARRRIRLALIGAAIIVCGLTIRRAGAHLPPFLAAYAPDALWATLVYVLLAMIFPRWPVVGIAITALLFSFAVETSQLYHAPWIDQIRGTRLGGLVLGYGFLWSDLLCYSAGVLLAGAVDALSRRRFGFRLSNR